MDSEDDECCHTLIIEPFYGGSHQQLIDLLMAEAPRCVKYTLPAKKWHWKARTSALHFAQIVPRRDKYKILFVSSVLNLAELIALRSDLTPLQKVIYFHENQLVYPVKKQQERDFQYGYNQILSCLVADTILFNSRYNMESFLSSIDSFLGQIPVSGFKSKGIHRPIRPKCRVLHFPLRLPDADGITLRDVGGCLPFSSQQKIANSSHHTSGSSGEDTANHEPSRRHSEEEASRGGGEAKTPNSPEVKVGKENMVRRNARRISDTDKRNDNVAPLTKANPATKPGENTNQDRGKEEVVSKSDVQVESPPGRNLAAKNRRAVFHAGSQKPLHILWAHRWEHDKNPELFFKTMMELYDMDLDFRLSVLGEQFHKVPDIFDEAKEKLQDHIVNWGYLPDKEDYYRALSVADVAVSTAEHEFFGVSMLEAVHLRCYPLCPNRLVYPEIFPKDYLYSTPAQLLKRLREFCRHPHLIRKHTLQVDVEQFSWEVLKNEYLAVLAPPVVTLRTKRERKVRLTSPTPSLENANGSTQSAFREDDELDHLDT